MRRRWLLAVILAAGLPAAAADVELPHRWQVRTAGTTGTLEVHVTGDGRLDATLLGAPAEGLLTGDVLVLRRRLGTDVELWQARIGRPADGPAFLAGSVTDGARVSPFYAVATADEPSAVATPVNAGEAPTAQPPTTAAAPAIPTPRPVPAAEARAWTGFDGPWRAPTGVVDVSRDGRSVEVVMPDGTVHQGRMTGDTTFVVGLGVACCKGELEGPDTVRWENGEVWRRAE